MGTVVQFERQSGERTIAPHLASALALQGTPGIAVARVEEAISRCKVVLVRVEKLGSSVDELKKLELVLSEPSDREKVERIVTSVKSQLSSQLAKLADSLFALREAAERASKIGGSPKRVVANPDP